MAEVPFHQTVMGRRFFEHTLPRLVEEVARLNEGLGRLAEVMEERPTPPGLQDGDKAATSGRG